MTFHAGQTEATRRDRAEERRQCRGRRELRPEGRGSPWPRWLRRRRRCSTTTAGQRISIDRAQRVESGQRPERRAAPLGGVERAVTVDYATRDGTADGWQRSTTTQLAGTVTFAANQRTASVNVIVQNDLLRESDQFFFLALSNPEGARFGAGDLAPRGIVWIRDDDAGTEKRALAVGDVKVSEGAGSADFTISLSRPLDDDLVIRYRTQNGSAGAKGLRCRTGPDKCGRRRDRGRCVDQAEQRPQGRGTRKPSG